MRQNKRHELRRFVVCFVAAAVPIHEQEIDGPYNIEVVVRDIHYRYRLRTGRRYGDYEKRRALNPYPYSVQAVKDMAIAAKVEIALLGNGHKVGINVHNNQVLLLVNPDTFNFKQLINKLSIVASLVEGVEDVQINKDEGCQFSISREQKFELPPKVLLVDDERDFVQTLSERLMVRNFGPHAVYDGQQALEFIKHENPDVMVIDLRMPGMNGLEVLRQVKKTNRNIEVIMLSGYGTLESERASMELGAFAFLHKPADFEKLTETIKAAYDKVASRKRLD